MAELEEAGMNNHYDRQERTPPIVLTGKHEP
jgi:hypothetical protein